MKLFRSPWFWCMLIGIIALPLLIWAAYRFHWSGTGFQGKTVWDWLSLLIIPLALALIAVFFNQMNTSTERQIAQQRYEQDKEAAEKRYERDQAIARQRYEQDKQIALDKQQEDLLQAYLDRISELLLEKGLRASQPDSEVRKVAQVRTSSVLKRLDAERVGDVARFLCEAGLMDQTESIVSLGEADFSQVNWSGADLTDADFSRAIFRHANLSGANFSNANLDGAYLVNANLSGTDFTYADLSGASLENADLTGAILRNAKIDKSDLTPEQIAQAIWDWD